LSDLSEQGIIKAFSDIAIAHHQLLLKRKIKAANELFDRNYWDFGRTFRSLPDKGKAALLALTWHEDPAVRAHAAFLLLPLDERQALKVLTDLAGKGLPWISTNAKITVEEWKAGRLDIEGFLSG
jgi:hypothetical protein